MSRASKLLGGYIEKAKKGEDLSDAKLVVSAMLPYFIREDDFYKLPKNFISEVLAENKGKIEIEDAKVIVEKSVMSFGTSALVIIENLECGEIGPDAAAEILVPLSNIPLIREILKGKIQEKPNSPVETKIPEEEEEKPESAKAQEQQETPKNGEEAEKQQEQQEIPKNNEEIEKQKQQETPKNGEEIEKPKDFISDIFSAISKGATSSVRYILFKEPNSVNSRNQYSRTPLHFAVENENVEIVKLLIDAGSDVNSKAVNSITPMFSAVASGNLEIAELLIEKGADLNARNLQNDTLLHLSIKQGNQEMLELLVKNGADLTAKNGIPSSFFYF